MPAAVVGQDAEALPPAAEGGACRGRPGRDGVRGGGRAAAARSSRLSTVAHGRGAHGERRRMPEGRQFLGREQEAGMAAGRGSVLRRCRRAWRDARRAALNGRAPAISCSLRLAPAAALRRCIDGKADLRLEQEASELVGRGLEVLLAVVQAAGRTCAARWPLSPGGWPDPRGRPKQPPQRAQENGGDSARRQVEVREPRGVRKKGQASRRRQRSARLRRAEAGVSARANASTGGSSFRVSSGGEEGPRADRPAAVEGVFEAGQ